jgi:hypothetical protein
MWVIFGFLGTMIVIGLICASVSIGSATKYRFDEESDTLIKNI